MVPPAIIFFLEGNKFKNNVFPGDVNVSPLSDR